MTVVGDYVEDLLVTASSAALVQEHFVSMGALSIQDPEQVQKVSGTRIEHENNDGYTLVQPVAIAELLDQQGLDKANIAHRQIGDECYEVDWEVVRLLEQRKNGNVTTVRNFPQLVRSLLWTARCPASHQL